MSDQTSDDDTLPILSCMNVCVREGDVMMIGNVRVQFDHRTRNRLDLRISAPLSEPIILLRDGQVKIGAHHKIPPIARA